MPPKRKADADPEASKKAAATKKPQAKAAEVHRHYPHHVPSCTPAADRHRRRHTLLLRRRCCCVASTLPTSSSR